MMGDLSEHFSLSELTVHPSTPQLDNTPDRLTFQRLSKLANYILERARADVGVPIKVTSAYRSPAVNTAIGGSGTSSHVWGCAADCVPSGMDILMAYKMLRDDVGLEYDQIIYEQKGTREDHVVWIHLGMVSPDHPTARRQALIYGPLTQGHYLPFSEGLVSFT
jgi:zinc D-Ala-D-Ala carboxypeptidase